MQNANRIYYAVITLMILASQLRGRRLRTEATGLIALSSSLASLLRLSQVASNEERSADLGTSPAIS